MANTCVFEFQVVAEDNESIEKALNHFNEENELRTLKGINHFHSRINGNHGVISGDCRWAVGTNMIYPEYIDQEKYITLQELAKTYNLFIKVDSEEFGFNFRERFEIDNKGRLLVDTCI